MVNEYVGDGGEVENTTRVYMRWISIISHVESCVSLFFSYKRKVAKAREIGGIFIVVTHVHVNNYLILFQVIILFSSAVGQIIFTVTFAMGISWWENKKLCMLKCNRYLFTRFWLNLKAKKIDWNYIMHQWILTVHNFEWESQWSIILELNHSL